MEYRVTWEIDIEADSAKDAAQQAFAHMQRPGTTATVFAVADEAGDIEQIDLDAECAECAAAIETRLMPCDECGSLDESAR